MLGILVADCKDLADKEIFRDLSVFVNQRNMLLHDLYFDQMQDPCQLIRIHNKIVKYFKRQKNVLDHSQSKNIIEINWNCQNANCFWCRTKQMQEQILLTQIYKINSYKHDYLLQIIVQKEEEIKYIDKKITLAGFDCIYINGKTVDPEKKIILEKFFSKKIQILISNAEVFNDKLAVDDIHTIYYDVMTNS